MLFSYGNDCKQKKIKICQYETKLTVQSLNI